MSVVFRLPDIGEGVAEAEVVRWLVCVGDEVEADQPVLEVQTDKVVVELPSPTAGQVMELKWKEGEIVPVGEVLYILGSKEYDIAPVSLVNEVGSTPTKKKRVLATPSTRRLARELGIEISVVSGTGEHGRVTDDDVRIFASSLHTSLSSAPPAREENVTISSTSMVEINPQSEVLEAPITPIRRVIGERLLHSVTHKPHATHFAELCVDGLVEWRKKRLAEQSDDRQVPRLTYLAILLKMIAVSLTYHRHFNAHYEEERQTIRNYSSISFGIATDTPKGLLVPVIHQVERKNIDQLALEISQMSELAKFGKLNPEQMRGSTFTVSNAGAFGHGQWATPIINPPEVAILAIHPIEQKPVVLEGQIVPGWRMNVSLSFDHRVLDGADAIRFTQTLEKYTSDPGRLVQELR